MNRSLQRRATPFRFLDLPLEIRRKIYHNFLVRSFPITDFTARPRAHPTDNSLSILVLCKRISDEALDVLYGSNVFQIFLYDDGGSDLWEVTEANRARIRKLQLIMRPRGRFYGSCGTLDPELWSPLLGQISKLLIVAQQPRFYGVPAAASRELDMQAWVKWVAAVLLFMAQRLQGWCRIDVDHGDREETSVLVQQCLPHGYRKVQTEIGDYCFLRGKFANKFGPW